MLSWLVHGVMSATTPSVKRAMVVNRMSVSVPSASGGGTVNVEGDSQNRSTMSWTCIRMGGQEV